MDFVLPTKGHTKTGVRKDPHGQGTFLAKRGKRLHKGLDLIGQPGLEIVSPINGRFDRVYRPYASDLQWRGAFIKGEELWVGMFYLTPYDNLLGRKLVAGQPIGVMQDISLKYGDGMKPHIHLETIIPPLCGYDGNNFYSGKIWVDPMLFVKF